MTGTEYAKPLGMRSNHRVMLERHRQTKNLLASDGTRPLGLFQTRSKVPSDAPA